ncbi:DNA-binding transcriptional regulator, MerR family [Nonomuraea maritima]|uniref:DNA-binding transcriptional regulator, MerR family n=1 Tax=Nonomuraea maritima TaxID=683260 RepID=A0A1G9BFN1_9ACTN|nr:MerR family transcriptional regulator [Nonomuraea maritima]SDK37665.1 DNA-binding transcriptional regulator, MerR family [Nonomuraea maritima]
MGWSTREVAQLAGTTLRAVRHYHDVGLLDEPERMANGYKSYGTEHLIRLLEIRRLTRLGLPLSTIAAMRRDDADGLEETLAAVEADLAARIAQLRQAQQEIAKLRRHPVETDLPFEVSVAAKEAELSTADRALYAVITQVAGEQGAPHWSALLRGSAHMPGGDEFDALPEDADEATRRRVADLMAPHVTSLLARRPLPADALPPGVREQSAFARTVIEAMLDLYNPAQLDVVARIWRAAGIA